MLEINYQNSPAFSRFPTPAPLVFVLDKTFQLSLKRSSITIYQHNNNKYYVLKNISRFTDNEYIRESLKLWKTLLPHPNIIPLLGVERCLWLTPMMNGSLSEIKLPKDIDITKKCLFEVGRALEYLHDQNIIHRNINPHTIFLSPEGDFCIQMDDAVDVSKHSDTSSPTGNAKLSNGINRSGYRAPELLTPTPDDKHMSWYGKGVDVWALASVCFYLATGEALFKWPENTRYYANLELALLVKAINEVDHTLKSLCEGILASMLTFDEKERVGIRKVLQQFSGPNRDLTSLPGLVTNIRQENPMAEFPKTITSGSSVHATKDLKIITTDINLPWLPQPLLQIAPKRYSSRLQASMEDWKREFAQVLNGVPDVFVREERVFFFGILRESLKLDEGRRAAFWALDGNDLHLVYALTERVDKFMDYCRLIFTEFDFVSIMDEICERRRLFFYEDKRWEKRLYLDVTMLSINKLGCEMLGIEIPSVDVVAELVEKARALNFKRPFVDLDSVGLGGLRPRFRQ